MWYVYRTTTTKQIRGIVRFDDGIEREVDISCYEYAYKPHRYGDPSDPGNIRAEKNWIEPVRRAFREKGKKPAEFGVWIHNGELDLDRARVFRTRRHIRIIDESIGKQGYYRVVGKLIKVLAFPSQCMKITSLKREVDHGRSPKMVVSAYNKVPIHVQLSLVNDLYIMRSTTDDGREVGKHTLHINHTDDERLFAHWEGFKETIQGSMY